MPKSTRVTHNASRPDLVAKSDRSSRTRAKPAPAPTHQPKKSTHQRRTKRGLTFSFLARSQYEIEADANRKTRLLSLPKELVQHITSDLPISSAICLTLTCKEAADIVGIQSWTAFKSEHRWSEQRKALFGLLLRDWAAALQWEFCPRCNTIHPPLKPPGSHRETKLTTYCFGQDAMVDYLPRDDLHGYTPVFLHIAEALKLSESLASKGDVGPPLELLSGDFTITKDRLSWRLRSTGQRIDGNLIIKHIHTFRSIVKKTLSTTDVLQLPVRLCPHQSTSISSPKSSRYIKSAELNGPLLSHAIITAFPATLRGAITLSTLKKPTPLEQEQISTAEAGEQVTWRCRSCPTKFRVEYDTGGLTITSWHSFGRDLYHASKYWKWLVRREGALLGTDKRNDEWWSPSRTVPDFECE